MPSSWKMLAIAGSAAVALASSAATAAAERSPEGKPPHVVIVLVDTLRVDHTSLEGYERDTTPALKALAAQGTTYRHHFANAPWTRPSVASLLTGLLPPSHGAQWGDHSREQGAVDLLPEGFTTLPEVLKAHHWSTHAFVTNPSIAEHLGFGQGFDSFELRDSTLEDDRAVLRSVEKTLDEARGPVFVYCHLMAPHNYRTPGPPQFRALTWKNPITEADEFGSILIDRYHMRTREQAVAVYDSTLRFVDSLLAELTEHVRRHHPETLLIVTSDHGEEFAEHGGYLHSRTLYNELLRVPLVLWGPGIPAGEVVEQWSSSVDLMPTILDYLDLPAPFSQGDSLLSMPPGAQRFVYAEKRNGVGAKRALMTSGGKWIESKPPGDRESKPEMKGKGSFEFFADPLGRDLVETSAAVPERDLRQAIARFREVWESSRKIFRETTGSDTVRGELTDADRKKLRALGYID